MGERRKHKSSWDTEDETKHLSGMRKHNSWQGKDCHSSHGSRQYHEPFDLRATISRKRGDHSGWRSWDSIEEHPIAPTNSSFKNTSEGKEIGGGKRYHKNFSSGFDGIESHNYDHAHKYDRCHPQRYMGRGRSWSRSRTRGRSRSRSLSRREREKVRGRGWSRSRSDGNANDHRRSHSPIGEFRCQSHGWSDKRSGPEKSSQICRDFASGRCRRESECRFFHPSSTSRGDDDLVEDNTVESWRSRADHSRIPKYSYTRSGFESRDDVPDPYDQQDEQFRNKSRSSVPCKDFMIGKCHWGETCRFSHRVASADSFGQGSRSTCFDKDFDHQQHKSGKPLCKFFAAGKCDRDSCRFSHEDPNLNNLEGRLDRVTDSCGSHDKSNLWNAWDDATRISDVPEPTGWGESIVTNTTSIGDTGNEQNDDKDRGIQERTNNSLNRENQPSLPGEGGSYDGDSGPTESIAEDNMASKQERLILHVSQLQNQDRIVNPHGLNALQENQSFSINALQRNVYPDSHIELQHCRGIENNPMKSFGSDVLDEVKDTRYTNHPICLSGQSLNQNGISMFPGHSPISNESDRGQNMLYTNSSNGFGSGLNRPETHIVNPLNVHIRTQNNKKVVQSLLSLEDNVPQFPSNFLTSTHSDQVTNLIVIAAGQQVSQATNPLSLTQSFVSHHPQTYAGIDASDSRGMLPSFSSTAGCPLPVNAPNVQTNPDAISFDQFNSMGNGRENTEHGNHHLAHGTEQNNQMQLKRSSPSSIVGREFDSLEPKHPESPKQQEDIVANLAVTGGTKSTGEENKDIQGNKPPETWDGHGILEEGSANKDEKEMRVFKNALIEFVKEILKPTWKEGRMSRDVHKTVVKKVVDKVSSTIQVDHIPKTRDKVEQYLSCSKPKITKLVQVYVQRCRKADA